MAMSEKLVKLRKELNERVKAAQRARKSLKAGDWITYGGRLVFGDSGR